MGKDNKEMEMVTMIVHVMRYVINEERREKSSYNRHVCNVQGCSVYHERLPDLGESG